MSFKFVICVLVMVMASLVEGGTQLKDGKCAPGWGDDRKGDTCGRWIYDATFESFDYGKWVNSNRHWSLTQGYTINSRWGYSGPSGSRSESRGTYYAYCNSYAYGNFKEGMKCTLTTKDDVYIPPNRCLQFYYYMYENSRGKYAGKYGSQLMGTLQLKKLGNHTEELWSKSGNQEKKWNSAKIPLAAGTYKLSIVAIMGKMEYYSDIAIDDITIVTCSSKDACAPKPCKNGGTCNRAANGGFTCSCADGYSGTTCQTDACAPNPCKNGGTCYREPNGYKCNCATSYAGIACTGREATLFDNSFGFGFWENSDYPWTIGKYTPSRKTGPTDDKNSKEGYFAYCEASSPRKTGDRFTLSTKEDVYIPPPNDSMCLKFQYHMYGNTMGTLRVERVENDGSKVVLWSKSRNQGKKWYSAEKKLDAGQYKLSFVGIRGWSWSSDIAIKDIKIEKC